MTIDELKTYLKEKESIRVEFKEAADAASKSVYETIVSFSNKEGGIILLGIDNAGNVVGVNPVAIDKIKKEMTTGMNNPQKISPAINLPIGELEFEGKTILYIKVPVSSQVHMLNHVIYDREHDSDIKITTDHRISEIYFRKRQGFTENEIFPFMEPDDFDPILFEKARKLITMNDPEHPWLSMTNKELMLSASLYQKDLRTGKLGYTLAAALIFGKDTTILNMLPAYKIEAMVRRNNLDRWDDRLTLRTNLIDSYNELINFVKKHLDDTFYLDDKGQRRDLRVLIFREIIGNMLVHREYTNNYSSDFIIYKDRVEVTNPNKVLFRGLINPNDFCPYAKNPTLRRFFTAFGWADEIGSGVRNVTNYMKYYVKGAQVQFIEADQFKVIVPLIDCIWGNRIKLLFDYIELDTTGWGDERLELLTELPLNYELTKLTDENIVSTLYSYWDTKRYMNKIDRFQNISDIENDVTQKDTSITLKRYMNKSLQTTLAILFYCIKAANPEELLRVANLSSRPTLRRDYITPFIKAGWIEYTLPDTPTSTKQKYQLSFKGKAILGGLENKE
ncbi:MAG: putative DNA binding domain-containing protein [Paludibacter sp.]|nr:putative DNA binding domain-containing protein [Paludibacter sp.]